MKADAANREKRSPTGGTFTSADAGSGSLAARGYARRLAHRMPTRKEWEQILEAIGPSGVQPAEYLANWIRGQIEMCERLQECVQKYNLGLGGEKVDTVVIAEVNRLRGEHK